MTVVVTVYTMHHTVLLENLHRIHVYILQQNYLKCVNTKDWDTEMHEQAVWICNFTEALLMIKK